MTYRVPSDLAWVLDETDDGTAAVLYLMHVPDGEPLVLTDTAALIWIFAAQGDDVPTALAGVVEHSPADLSRTTDAYLVDLVGRGLLVAEEDDEARMDVRAGA